MRILTLTIDSDQEESVGECEDMYEDADEDGHADVEFVVGA